MSRSIKDLLASIEKGAANVQTNNTKLMNPDIPAPQNDFANDRNIRDQWFNDRKLSNNPRGNGGNFSLGKGRFTDDPRLDSFMQDGSIDPNTIRKKVDPDSARPSLQDAASVLYSLQATNLVGSNSIGLVQKARKSYVNYRDRFNVTETPPSQLESAPKTTMRLTPNYQKQANVDIGKEGDTIRRSQTGDSHKTPTPVQPKRDQPSIHRGNVIAIPGFEDIARKQLGIEEPPPKFGFVSDRFAGGI
jgi:hypothetical protein